MPVRQYSHIKQFVDFRDRQSSQAVTLGRLFCESLDIQLVVYTVFNLRHAITVILNNKYRMSTQFREVFQIMVSRLCSIPPERFSSIPNCIEIDVGLLTWTDVKMESRILVHPDRMDQPTYEMTPGFNLLQTFSSSLLNSVTLLSCDCISQDKKTSTIAAHCW